MNDSSHRKFVEELLRQSPQFNSAQYQEYRHQLDQKLKEAQRESRYTRRVVAGAWIVTGLFYLLSLQFIRMHPGAPPDGRWGDAIIMIWVEGLLLAPLAALLLLGLHLFKYQRRVSRARAEAEKAALAELQRQINEMREQVAALTKASSKS